MQQRRAPETPSRGRRLASNKDPPKSRSRTRRKRTSAHTSRLLSSASHQKRLRESGHVP